MIRLPRMLRQSLTVARRDFTATVFTPAFLLFLLAPLFIVGFGAIGGLGAESVAGNGEDRVRIVVIAPPADTAAIIAGDRDLRRLFPTGEETRRAPLIVEKPSGDIATQAHALLESNRFEATAVLYGPLDRPQILYRQRGGLDAEYLAKLADDVVRVRATGGGERISQATRTLVRQSEASASRQGKIASLGVFGLFFVTLFLSGQAVGTMAEERSNKVIEILAAAVPLESVFFGKLIGMFGSAVLFVLFWATLLINAAKFLPGEFAHVAAEIAPAIGGLYPLLFALYFAMAYLLLGAVFLSIGAQTSTQRELQLLSLPITIFQMLMFGFSLAAASRPESWIARAAEIFPFSSPFAMIARAGYSGEVWPHLLALLWQGLWVALVITLGARWFRRGVLKSGSPKFRLKFGR